jgi:cytochrome c oxidase subunit 3
MVLNKFNQKHPFHLVDPSPWPFIGANSAFFITTGSVLWFHSFQGGTTLMSIGFFLLIFTMFVWWRDIIREGTFEGQHTTLVQLGLRYGMILFIVSEVMFFFAFFWAFFWAALMPTPEIGSVWPPQNIDVLSAFEIPFLNTVILLTSGATGTWCHHSVVYGNKEQAKISLFVTIILAAIFTGCQAFEYINATFTISDSIYGSCFYMATGFHGFHVFIGTCFLTVCFFRILANHYTQSHHFGLEAALWYWHFVDVVWLFLFVAVYWWGGLL